MKTGKTMMKSQLLAWAAGLEDVATSCITRAKEAPEVAIDALVAADKAIAISFRLREEARALATASRAKNGAAR